MGVEEADLLFVRKGVELVELLVHRSLTVVLLGDRGISLRIHLGGFMSFGHFAECGQVKLVGLRAKCKWESCASMYW